MVRYAHLRHPSIMLRCFSNEHREKIHELAKLYGLSTQQYLLKLVSNDLDELAGENFLKLCKIQAELRDLAELEQQTKDFMNAPGVNE